MKKFVSLLLTFIAVLGCCVFTACSGKPDPDDEKFKNAVSYSDFGAVGDGKTDDFEALKKAKSTSLRRERTVFT